MKESLRISKQDQCFSVCKVMRCLFELFHESSECSETTASLDFWRWQEYTKVQAPRAKLLSNTEKTCSKYGLEKHPRCHRGIALHWSGLCAYEGLLFRIDARPGIWISSNLRYKNYFGDSCEKRISSIDAEVCLCSTQERLRWILLVPIHLRGCLASYHVCRC